MINKKYVLFIAIHTLWLVVTRGYGASRLPRSWNGEGEAIWKVPRGERDVAAGGETFITGAYFLY